MSGLIWLTKVHRIALCFSLSQGVPRVDDQRFISEIIFVIHNQLCRRDPPKEYGPHKTIYNGFIRWSRLDVFNRIFAELSATDGKPDHRMIDTTHLKTHRTAPGLPEGLSYPSHAPGISGTPKAP